METKHAPLPWHIKSSGTFDQAGIMATVKVPSEKGKYPITILTVDYTPFKVGVTSHVKDQALRDKTLKFFTDLEKNNLEFIVKAVNSHYDLLKAVEDLIKYGTPRKNEDGEISELSVKALQFAIKTIKKVTEI